MSVTRSVTITSRLEKLSQVSQCLDSIADSLAELIAVAWIVVCHDFVAEFADESEDE